tara:strand:- start:196 stop:786 length:591 start_codon:yes stop_codon:yes gene_type:complete
LLKTIAGLIKPISGTISISGKSETFPKKIFSQTRLKKYFQSIRKRGFLGYIPQNLGLVRHATVMHNVMLGSNAGHKKYWTPIPSFQAKEAGIEAIKSLGISDYKYQIIRKLSGGQKRRVATARTLAQKPKLILADEFLSELDELTKHRVKNAVLSYISDNNASIIIVEHDIDRARKMSDRLFQISDGKLVELKGEI